MDINKEAILTENCTFTFSKSAYADFFVSAHLIDSYHFEKEHEMLEVEPLTEIPIFRQKLD